MHFTLENVCICIGGGLSAWHAGRWTFRALLGAIRQSPPLIGRKFVLFDPRWVYLFVAFNLLEFWVSYAIGYGGGLTSAASNALVGAQVALTLEASSLLKFMIINPAQIADSSRFRQMSGGAACLIGANLLALWDVLTGPRVSTERFVIWIAIVPAAILFYFVAWACRKTLANNRVAPYMLLWSIAAIALLLLGADLLWAPQF